MIGPQHPFAQQLHATKYRQEGETFEGGARRVAHGLADNQAHEAEFLDITIHQRFMPAGRVQAAIGAAKAVTPYNCYVAPTIDDSFVEGEDSIMGVASKAAATMRMGGGIGYDFSTLRPKGALISGLGSASSGPRKFMDIFNAVCHATSSAGNRRGAQMGVLRVDHPDIVEFVTSKNNIDQLNGFNISVATTDEFMEAVHAGKNFNLKFGGKLYDHMPARELYDMMMLSTWDWAEPGILFIDTINRRNNLWYCERIAATNPCGEQPLPPNGACLLGSYNAVKYVRRCPVTRTWYFDFHAFKADIPVVVRAMDNVVDRALYPLPAQEIEAKSKRRMGLGFTGLANAIEACGHPYGTAEYLAMHDELHDILRDEAYLASADLAAEKGSFPLFDADLFLQGEFARSLPERVRHAIRTKGLRNSHLTSIAPTGTISMTADNVSSGLECTFEEVTQRPVIMPEGTVVVQMEDYGVKHFGTKPKTTEHVTLDEHLAVLLSSSARVDSAVSKTCNTAGNATPMEDFKRLYQRAWEGGAKGITTFNKDGKRLALLTAAWKSNAPAPGEPAQNDNEQPAESCTFDPATGRRSCE